MDKCVVCGNECVEREDRNLFRDCGNPVAKACVKCDKVPYDDLHLHFKLNKIQEMLEKLTEDD